MAQLFTIKAKIKDWVHPDEVAPSNTKAVPRGLSRLLICVFWIEIRIVQNVQISPLTKNTDQFQNARIWRTQVVVKHPVVTKFKIT